MPTIAVLKFSGDDSGLSEVLSQAFSTELVKSKRFKVIEYQQLDKLLEKAELDLSGLVTPDQAVKIGKLCGCKLLATGTIMNIGERRSQNLARAYAPRELQDMMGSDEVVTISVTVNYKVIDAETGEVWRQDTESGRASEDAESFDRDRLVTAVATNTVTTFIPKLAPELRGKVAAVEPDCLVINLGSSHGVTESCEFQIKGPGTPITDPDSGKVISNGSKVICLARVIKDSIEPLACKLEIGNWKDERKHSGWTVALEKLSQIKVGHQVVSVAAGR